MSILLGIAAHLAINALVIVYAAAAAVVGIGILRLLDTTRDTRFSIPETAAAFLFGQAVLGTLWQTLAVFGAFYWWLVAAFLLGILAGGALAFAPAFSAARETAWRPSIGREEKPFAIAAIAAMILFAPLSLLPPGTDAMAFYISQPKLIAATHSFTPLASYEAFAQLGLSSEMHYAALFALGGDHIGGLAGKLFIWVVGAANLSTAWGIGQRLKLAPLGCWFIVILILTSTAVTLILWDGKTDLVPAGLALAAIYFLLAPELRKGDIGAAGACTGLACVGKLSFVPSFGLTIGLLFLRRLYLDRDPGSSLVKHVAATGALFAAFAAIPFAFLVLKNTIVAGEPLAPFFFFGDTTPFPLDQVWFSPENTRWILSTYPLALVFGQYPMQHGNISVLLLAMCPLLLLPAVRKAANGTVLWLAVAGIAGTIAWVVLRPSVLAPRYILPSLLVLTPAVAVAMVWFWRLNAAARVVLTVAVAAPMLLTASESLALINMHRTYLVRLPAKLGSPIWRTADIANNSKRPDTRVFNLMYYSSMYRADLLKCMLALDPDTTKAMKTSTADFWTALYKRGVTHISYDKLTHKPRLANPLDPLAAPPWLDVKETRLNDRFSSFELFPRSGAPSVEEHCTIK